MRIGLLSDVHGNIVALEACLRFLDQKNIDQWVFLGDLVGYLTQVAQCDDLLKARNARQLAGNHDAMMLAALPAPAEREAIYLHDPARTQLNARQLVDIAQRTCSLEHHVNGRSLLFVHGSPQDPCNGYVYPDADMQPFADLAFDAVFMGHTHRPFATRVGDMLVVNIGSCGLPRDVGALASCAVYDVEDNRCDVYRVPFDVHEAIEACEKVLHQSVLECLHRTSQSPVFGNKVS